MAGSSQTEATRLESGALRLVVFRDQDRCAHRLELTSGLVLLSSVEGTPDERWPPSPPLQEFQLHHTDRADPAALLVGMAGRSHWSLSVEAVPESEVGRFEFDAACRTSERPERLGSEYGLAERTSSRLVENGLEIDFASAGVRVLLRTLSGCRVQTERNRLRIVATGGMNARSTVRWKYAFELQRLG